MTVADRLKNERKKNGLSQKEFANKLGINARTYASYERGERDISTSVLLNICKTLNISSDVILGNDSDTPDISPQSLACELTGNELEMITIFKKLPPTQQGMLIERAKVMLEDNENEAIGKENVS